MVSASALLVAAVSAVLLKNHCHASGVQALAAALKPAPVPAVLVWL